MNNDECWNMLRVIQLAFWYTPRTRHDFTETIQTAVDTLRSNLNNVNDKYAFLSQLNKIIP